MVAYSEAKELDEKGFLLSSCCPAFVAFTEKNGGEHGEDDADEDDGVGGQGEVQLAPLKTACQIWIGGA